MLIAELAGMTAAALICAVLWLFVVDQEIPRLSVTYAGRVAITALVFALVFIMVYVVAPTRPINP